MSNLKTVTVKEKTRQEEDEGGRQIIPEKVNTQSIENRQINLSVEGKFKTGKIKMDVKVRSKVPRGVFRKLNTSPNKKGSEREGRERGGKDVSMA